MMMCQDHRHVTETYFHPLPQPSVIETDTEIVLHVICQPPHSQRLDVVMQYFFILNDLILFCHDCLLENYFESVTNDMIWCIACIYHREARALKICKVSM